MAKIILPLPGGIRLGIETTFTAPVGTRRRLAALAAAALLSASGVTSSSATAIEPSPTSTTIESSPTPTEIEPSPTPTEIESSTTPTEIESSTTPTAIEPSNISTATILSQTGENSIITDSSGSPHSIDPNSLVLKMENGTVLAISTDGQIITGTVNFQDFNEIGQIPMGPIIKHSEVVQNDDGEWILQNSDATLHVSKDKVEIQSETTMYVKTSGNPLNLRSSPNISDDNIIDTIPHGFSVKTLGETKEADGYLWFKVKYNSKVAWVAGKYLSNTKPEIKQPMYVNTSKAPLNLRSSPNISDDNIIDTISRGSSVKVTGESKEADGYIWFEIEYNSKTGWVVEKYLSRTKPEISQSLDDKTSAAKYITGIDVSRLSAGDFQNAVTNSKEKINFSYIEIGSSIWASEYDSESGNTLLNDCSKESYINQIKICEELQIPYGLRYTSSAITNEEAEQEFEEIKNIINELISKSPLNYFKLGICINKETKSEVSNDRQRQNVLMNSNGLSQNVEAIAHLINLIQETGLSDLVTLNISDSAFLAESDKRIINLSSLFDLLKDPYKVPISLGFNGNYGYNFSQISNIVTDCGFEIAMTQLPSDVDSKQINMTKSFYYKITGEPEVEAQTVDKPEVESPKKGEPEVESKYYKPPISTNGYFKGTLGLDTVGAIGNGYKKLMTANIPDSVKSSAGTFNISTISSNEPAEFAMIKISVAGWGSNSNKFYLKYADSLESQITTCEKLGIPYGLYHYSTSVTNEEAEREAKLIIDKIKDLKKRGIIKKYFVLGVSVDREIYHGRYDNGKLKDRQIRKGNTEGITNATAYLINRLLKSGQTDLVSVYTSHNCFYNSKDSKTGDNLRLLDMKKLYNKLDDPSKVFIWLSSHIRNNGNHAKRLTKDLEYLEKIGYQVPMVQFAIDLNKYGDLNVANPEFIQDRIRGINRAREDDAR